MMDAGTCGEWCRPGLRPAARGWLGLCLGLLVGCASGRADLDPALVNRSLAASPGHGAEQYTVHCPDVLEVAVAGRPDLSGPRPVGPDGRVELPGLGRLRVEGRTAAELVQAVAAVSGRGADQVSVRVAEYRSQQIYLFGEVFGAQRAVPYRGPEHVLDLLHRVGGLAPGAASGGIYVVRPHVADGRAPEVFHIDLRGIVASRDPRTNVLLQPFDEVHVGETRQSCVQKCMPPCLRPVYEALCAFLK